MIEMVFMEVQKLLNLTIEQLKQALKIISIKIILVHCNKMMINLRCLQMLKITIHTTTHSKIIQTKTIRMDILAGAAILAIRMFTFMAIIGATITGTAIGIGIQVGVGIHGTLLIMATIPGILLTLTLVIIPGMETVGMGIIGTETTITETIIMGIIIITIIIDIATDEEMLLIEALQITTTTIAEEMAE